MKFCCHDNCRREMPLVFTNLETVFNCLWNGQICCGLLDLTCYRGSLSIHLIFFHFRRVTSLKLLKLKDNKRWFANNDFPNTVLITLEQAFSKSAYQIN